MYNNIIQIYWVLCAKYNAKSLYPEYTQNINLSIAITWNIFLNLTALSKSLPTYGS